MFDLKFNQALHNQKIESRNTPSSSFDYLGGCLTRWPRGPSQLPVNNS